MKLSQLLKTWEGLQAENRWSRISVIVLLLIVLLLSLKVFHKESIIVLHPDTPDKEVWVTKSKASQSYKEAWGLFFAQLIGNVTPGSLDFIRERLQPLLSPKIYQEVLDALNTQAQQIKNDRLSLRFEPKYVEYEAASDKVFVRGTSFESGLGSKNERGSDRTYEFKIIIHQYGPLITSICTYSGPPRTLEVQQKQAANAPR